MKRYFLLFILFLIFSQSMAQESNFKKFCNLHFAEKVWVLTHPFVAKKALAITNKAQSVANKMIHDKDFDGDYNGGQVDAFRHSFWMASLSQKIGYRKAVRLGKAHEKGNKKDFDNKVLEEGSLPCFVSCEMDLRNNEVGARIGKKHKNATQEELITIVKEKVLEGRMFIVKKNNKGEFLTSQDKIIDKKDYIGKWFTPKTLVSSNYIKK